MPILGSTGGASVRAFLPVSFKRRLPGWSYGKKIVIPNQQVDANLTNFPVTVYLDSTNFDFSKAKADGSDIRFTDKDYNHLKFERKEHSSGFDNITFDNGLPSSWVYEPTTVGNGSSSISNSQMVITSNMYYGNPYFLYGLKLTQNSTVDITSIMKTTVDGGINSTGGMIYIFDGVRSLYIYVKTNGISYYTGSAITQVYAGNFSSSFNTIRVLKTGTTDIKIYVNNSLVSTIPYTSILSDNATARIGFAAQNGATAYFDNFSYTVIDAGNAVYNVQLPLVSDTVDTEFYMWYGNSAAYNTSIEAWQDQTGKQLTYNGNVKLTPNVGGAYFNGSSYLNIPSSSDVTIGTSNFCIEFAFNTSNMNSTYRRIVSTTTGGFGPGTLCGRLEPSNKFSVYSGYTAITSTTTFLANTTYHIAIVRDSGILKLFVNGVLESSASDSTVISESLRFIGGYYSVSTNEYYLGNIQAMRFTIGIPRYSASYAPNLYYTVDSTNVKLCLLFNESYNSTTFIDLTGKIVTNNGSVIATGIDQTKRSAYFDGSGDYFTMSQTNDLTFGTGDFCAEAWVNIPTSSSAERTIFGLDVTGGFLLNVYQDKLNLGCRATAYDLSANITIPLNTTTHLAITKSSGVITLWQNGVNVGSATISRNYPLGNPFIGAYTTSSGYFNGYISGVRITKGRARYTANFTPPTSFVIDGTDVVFNTNFDTVYDSNYVMVQHMGSSLVDASGNGRNLTQTSTTLVSTHYGTSRSFDGSNSYMTLPSPMSQDFTVVSLIKHNSFNGNVGEPYITSDWSASYRNYLICILTDGRPHFLSGNGSATQGNNINTPALTLGTYNALVFSRQSTNGRIFVNAGTSVAGSLGYTSNATSNGAKVGATSDGTSGRMNAILSAYRESNIARSDAWIKLESKALKNNVLEFADVDDSLLLSKEYELLGDITVGTATTSISFNNLDIGPEDELVLVSEVVAGGTGSSCYLYVNNNSTSTNYYSQFLSANSSSVSGIRVNYPTLIGLPINNKHFSIAPIKLTNSGYLTYQSNILANVSSSGVSTDTIFGTSTFTISSITQLSITATVTNAIGVGSRFQLYKINGTAVV